MKRLHSILQTDAKAMRRKVSTVISVRWLMALLLFLTIAHAGATSITSAATGNWSVGATWVGGTVPATTDTVIIAATHVVTLDANQTCRVLTISGTLTMSANTLTVAIPAQNNANVSINSTGVLTIGGGNLIVNGGFFLTTGGTLNQSGGEIAVDGNNGGVTATSVPAGTALVSFGVLAPANFNLTGGVFTIVDPHAAIGGSDAISFATGVHTVAATTNHTFKLGNGVSTDAGGNTVGFQIRPWASAGLFKMGNLTIDASTGTNRTVTTLATSGALIVAGNLTITSGELRQTGTVATTGAIHVAGNINNNGTLTIVGTLYLGSCVSSSATVLIQSASTLSQTISGTGVFRNSATSGTASIAAMTINNSNATGVAFNAPAALSFSGAVAKTQGIVNYNNAASVTFLSNVNNTSGNVTFSANTPVTASTLWGNTAGIITFNANATVNASINIQGGAFSIAAGKTLTVLAASVSVADGIQGAGNFVQTSPTLQLLIGGTGPAIQAGTVGAAIRNTGTITINTNTFFLNGGAGQSTGTSFPTNFTSGLVQFAAGTVMTISQSTTFFNLSGSTSMTVGGSSNTVTVNGTFTLPTTTVVNSGNTLVLNGTASLSATQIVSGAGNFTVGNGATFATANLGGITSSGATGSIQVTGIRTFSPAASYTFNGAATQVSGNGLPATLTGGTVTFSTISGSTLSQPTTFNNLTATTTFTSCPAITVNGVFTIGAAFTTANNITLNGTSAINSTLTVNSTGGLTINGSTILGANAIAGTGTFTTGPAAIFSLASTNATGVIGAGNTGNFSISGTRTWHAGTSFILIGNVVATGALMPANIDTLIINTTSNVTLSQATNVTNVTLMNTGNIVTTTAFLLTVNSNLSTAVSRTSAGYINGPMAWTLPANYQSNGTLLFPVGKTAYQGVELLNPVVNSGGSVTIQTEYIAGAPGGVLGTGLSGSLTPFYWSADVTGTGAFSSISNIRLVNTGFIAGQKIGLASALTGTYNSIGGSYASGSLMSGFTVSLSSSNYFAAATGTSSGSFAGGTIAIGPSGTYSGYTVVSPSITSVLAAMGENSSLTAPVILELQNDYVSSVEGYPVNFTSSLPTTSTNTLIIRPANGVSSVINFNPISGNTTAVFNIDGGKYITIDGRNGGTGNNQLITLNNPGNGPALQLINDAQNDTFRYINVVSSNTAATSGVVVIGSSTGVEAFNGNSNNAITNCNINGNATSPNGIYAVGAVSPAGNKNNTISNNNVFDNFSNTALVANIGMNLKTNNTAWTITNNRLYQTALRTFPNTGASHNGINIGGGNAYTISGNSIGYANATGTGTTNLYGSNSVVAGTFPAAYASGSGTETRYIGINASFDASGTVSEIQGNTIAGIALFTQSGVAADNGVLCGISIVSGNANVGTVTGNTIGSASGLSSLYACGTFGGHAVVGICAASSNTVTIQNNTIGSIDAVGSSANATGAFTGIDVTGTGTFTISGNTIGNSTANNIRVGYTLSGTNLSNSGTLTSTTGVTNPGPMVGIRHSAGGATVSITNNILQGWQNGTTVTGQLTGITCTGNVSSAVTITGNQLGTASQGWINYAFANTYAANAAVGISLTGSGTATAHTIQNNDFRGVTFTTSGAMPLTFINLLGATAANDVSTISGNTFTGLNVNTTGAITFINHDYSMAATATQTITNNNIVTSFNKGATGAVSCITGAGGSANGAASIITNNNFSNITIAGGSTVTGINNTDGSLTSPTRTVTGNVFNNWNGSTSAITGITFGSAGTGSVISNNTITNIAGQSASGLVIGTTFGGSSLTVAGNTITGLSSSTGDVTGLACSNLSSVINITGNTITGLSSTGSSFTVTGAIIAGATTTNFYSNTINTLAATGSTSPTVNGLSITGGAIVNAYQNVINTLSNSGITLPVVNGVLVSGGASVNVYRNKIHDLLASGAAISGQGIVNGIRCSGGSGNVVTASNNIIGDLRATDANSTDALRGINIASVMASTAYNFYHNTVYLTAASTGSNFGSSGIYHAASTSSATASLDLRNNIIVNTSTPAGTGLTVAYRRSAGTANTLNNYAGTSDNNLFYAGTPGTSNLLYSDGVSSAQTMGAYKAGVFTAGTIEARDAGSVSETVNWLSTISSNTNFGHINGATASQLESGGSIIGPVTDDFDGGSRAGYPLAVQLNGGGIAPDIGADEFDGIPLDLTAPTFSYPVLGHTSNTISRVLTNFATITDANKVDSTTHKPRIYYKKITDANTFGGNTSAANGWKWVAASNANSPFSFTVDYSILNGGSVSVGDVIQYFIVAQDLTTPSANVASSPANGFSGTNVASVTVAPTTPNSYAIVSAVSGTLAIGGNGAGPSGGCAYATLTEAFGDITPGGVKAIRITAGGAGYGSAPAVVFTGGGGSGGTATAVVTSGAVSAVLISNYGTGYTSAPTISFTGGGGAGATATAVVSYGTEFTGATILSISSTYSSTYENFPIVIPSMGSMGISASQTLTIMPATAAVTITGSNTGPILSLNGANYLTIDGRIGGAGSTNAFTIENTSTATTANTIQFINEASNDTIKYCNIRGAGTANTTGNILFGTTTGNTGNDNNVIDHCAIYDASTGTPQHGIHAVGSTTTAAHGNDNCTISNCNIYNFFTTASGGMRGINIGAGNSGWTITGNSFYQTASRTGATSVLQFLAITPGTNTVGFTVTNNYFGGTQPLAASGICTFTGGSFSAEFKGVLFVTPSSGAVNSFQGNVFKNISFSSTANSSNVQCLLQTDNACMNIGTVSPNYFGDSTTAGSVTVSFGSITHFSAMVIGHAGAGICTIQNNVISGIALTSGASSTAACRGIQIGNTTAVTSTISGNIIGSKAGTGSITSNTNGAMQGIFFSSTSNALQTISNNTVANLSSTGGGTGNVMVGINATSNTCNYTISGNTIYNLTTNSTAVTNTVLGINYSSPAIAGATVTGNTINNLLATASSVASQVTGILYGGPTAGTNIVSGNTIYADSIATSSTSGSLFGINITSGTTTISNNLTVLGLGKNNTPISNGYSIRGINVTGGSNKFYFNTSRVTGSVASGVTSSTYAFISTSSTDTLKNNMFLNDRTGGTTGIHYAIKVAAGAVLNNNNYYVSGSVLGNNGVDVTAIPILSGQDANSYSMNPLLTTTGIIPNSCFINNKGTTIATVTTDYTGAARNASTPDIGAYEFTPAPVATPAITSPITYCQNATATALSATGSNTLLWFTFNNGGAGVTTVTPSTTTPGTTTYYVADSNTTTGCISSRASQNVVVTTPVSGNTITGNQTICNGTVPVTIARVTPSGGDGVLYNYSWMSSTIDSLSGFGIATGANNGAGYAPSALTQTTWYRREVTSGACAKDTSAAIKITVDPVIASNIISGAQSIITGATPSGLTGATPTGGNGSTYSYQWQTSTSSATTGFTNATGVSTMQHYNPASLSQTTWYRRMVSSGACSDTSSTLLISVFPVISSNNLGSNQSICNATVPAQISGSNPAGGNGSYSYQWLSSTTNGTAGFTAAAGVNNTQNYTPASLTTTTWYKRIVESIGGADTSLATQIIVNPVIASNTIASAQSIITGSIPASLSGSTPTGGNGSVYTYQWMSSTTGAGAGFVNAGGVSTLQDYAPGTLTQTTWYKRITGSGGCSDTSSAIQVSVFPVLSNNTVGSSQVICNATIPAGLSGSTTGGGNGTYAYQWLSSTVSSSAGFVFASGTSNTQNYAPSSLTATTWYKRVVSSIGGVDTSASIQVVVNPILSTNTILGTQSIITGITPSIVTGSTPTGGNGVYTYMWLVSTSSATTGLGLAGGTNNAQNYSPGALTVTTWYRRLTTSGGCADTSAAIIVTVNPLIAGNTIAGAQTVCSGAAPSSITGSTPTGGDGSYTFKWISSTTSGTAGFANAAGTNSNQNYSPVALTQKTWFKRIVLSSGGADTSSNVVVDVNVPVANNTLTGVQSLCSGNTPTGLTGTLPTGGNGSTYTYAWLSSITSPSAEFSAASGTNNTQHYSPSVLTQTTWYRRAVNSGVCSVDTSVAVMVTVNPNLTASVSMSATATSVCGSGSITFTATPTNGGTTPSYQWKLNGTNVGTNSNVYILATPVTGDSIYVVLTSNATPCLVNTAANSNGIKLSNSTVTPSVNITVADSFVCAGVTTTFTATPVNGGASPAYQWKLNGVNVGTNSNTYSSNSFVAGDSITVVLTSNANCLSTPTATSNFIRISIRTATTINAQPVSISRCVGSSASFSIVANGDGTRTYQWKRNDVDIVGANATSFTIATPALTDSGSYTVAVTAACGSVISSVGYLTMTAPVANNTTTGAQSTCSGSTAAQLTGSTPTGGNGSGYTYLWQASTAGAATGFSPATNTNNTQNYQPGAVTQTTWYRRVISSGVCAADTSGAVQIIVTPSLTGNAASGAQTLCAGSTASVITGSVPTGGSGSYAYSWLASASSANAGFGVATGTTSGQNYTPAAMSQTTWFRRLVISGSCTDTTIAVQVTVNPVLAGNTLTGTQTICLGSSAATLLGGSPTGGSGSYVYTWLTSTSSATTGFAVASGTNNAVNYNPGAVTVTTWFKRLVVSGPCSDTSTFVVVTVNPTLAGNTITGVQTVCSGSAAANISGAVPTGGTGSYTYSWLASASSATAGFAEASGTNNTTSYTPGILSTTTWYGRLVVSGSCSDTSAAVQVTVNPVLSNNAATGTQTICSGTNAGTINGATPTGGTGTYNYSWLASTVGATSGFAIANGTNNTINYAPGNVTTTTWYRRLVSSGACSDTSVSVQVTVNPVIIGNTATGTQTICAGSAATVISGSTPIGGTGIYAFSWLASVSSATTGFAPASGTNNVANYTPGILTTTTWYRRSVSSGSCSDTTIAIQVTVNPVIANNTATGTQTICAGSPAASITGSTPTGGTGTFTYSWLASTSSATAGFSAIASGNTQNYSPAALTQTTWYRRYIVSGGCSDTTVAVQVTVNPVITNNTAAGTQTICSGSIPANITGATPTGGTGVFTYSWLASTNSATSGFNAIASGNTQNYSPAALTQTTWFRRSVSSGGCSDTSIAIQVTVNPVIAGNTVTGIQSVCSGSPVAIMNGSTPTGGTGTFTYSWLASTSSATAGFAVAGGTNNAVNYSPGGLTATTWFRRLVSSGGCADTSVAVQVTVTPAIVGNTITGGQTICTGNTAAGMAGSTPTGGVGIFTYSWLSSTSSATTGFAIASGTTTGISYAPGARTVTTWFKRVATSGSCSDTTAAVQVEVTVPVANNTINGAQLVCPLGVPSVLPGSTPTGGNGASYTYLWESSSAGPTSGFTTTIYGVSNTQNFTPTVGPQQTIWFRRTVTSGACAADISATVQVTVNAPGTWTGVSGNAWNNPANWSCPSIPTSGTDVAIPSAGVTNMPMVTDSQMTRNLTIQAGATLTLNTSTSQLVIWGDIINNGTFLNTNGKVTLSGNLSAGQTLPAGTYASVGIRNFFNVNLGGAATITDSLILTTGKLILGANNLTMGNTSAVSPGTATSYISTNGTGALVVQNVGATGKTGAVLLPVGNSTFNPVTLTNAGTTDTYTVRVIDGVSNSYSGTTLTGPNLTSGAVNRTWIINEGTAGGSNATVSLQWDAADQLAGFTRAASYIARYNGTTWTTNLTTSAATGTNPYVQTRSSITAFSVFGVGSNGVLPVELLSFTANKRKEAVKVNWVTASEINNDHFVLQRSADGQTFEDIATVKGNGTTNLLSTYSYIDNKAMAYAQSIGATTLYYRLIQVDFDNSATNSEVVVVNMDVETTEMQVSVSPNPFTDVTSVIVNAPMDSKSILRITDVQGRLVVEKSIGLEQGVNTILVDELAPDAYSGIYLVNIITPTESIVKRIVKGK